MDTSKHRLPARIATDRLVLTTPGLEHVPEMAVLANNKTIHAVLSRLPHPYDESHGRFFVEQVARGSEYAWSILLQGHFVGVIGLHFLPGQQPELGYWLGEPYWGRGYATEAAIAVVAAARAAGAAMLRSRALMSNAGSRNVLRKAGFIETGETIDASGALAGKPVMEMQLDFGS